MKWLSVELVKQQIFVLNTMCRPCPWISTSYSTLVKITISSISHLASSNQFISRTADENVNEDPWTNTDNQNQRKTSIECDANRGEMSFISSVSFSTEIVLEDAYEDDFLVDLDSWISSLLEKHCQNTAKEKAANVKLLFFPVVSLVSVNKRAKEEGETGRWEMK